MNIFLFNLSATILLSGHVLALECGMQRMKPNEFIIGGEDATEGEFPWFVSYAGCGAALIRNNWVLTAAHCLMSAPDISKTNESIYNIAYVDVFDSNITEKHQARVIKLIQHEEFNYTLDYDKKIFSVKNDIGLVQIDPDTLELTDRLMPICLPDSNVILTNECWIAGFGDDNKTHFPSKLQKLEDWVSTDQKCLDVDKYFNPEQELCIGGTSKGGTGACHGDSGSAFQCKATNGRFYQLGITSHSSLFGGACAQPNAPDIYTRVLHYIDWIEKTIKDNS